MADDEYSTWPMMNIQHDLMMNIQHGLDEYSTWLMMNIQHGLMIIIQHGQMMNIFNMADVADDEYSSWSMIRSGSHLDLQLRVIHAKFLQ